MWNLIRFFPLSFGEHTPNGNEVWNFCISFCQVVEMLWAATFTRGDLNRQPSGKICFIVSGSKLRAKSSFCETLS